MQPENTETPMAPEAQATPEAPMTPITPEKAPKQTWKIIGIIAIVLVIIMGGIIAFLLISQADNKDNDTADAPADCVAQNDDEASYEKTTHTTLWNKLKFDYPSEWEIEEAEETEANAPFTVIKLTTKLGTNLYLYERKGNLPSSCNDLCGQYVYIHKVADTKIDGLSVVAGAIESSSTETISSFYVSNMHGAVKYDDALFSNSFLMVPDDITSNSIEFSVDGAPESDEEQQQIIDTLSSLRKS